MIYPATQKIYDAFRAKGYGCAIRETERFSVVEAGFIGEKMPKLLFRFISSDTTNGFSVRSEEIAKIDPVNRQAAFEAINQIHLQYKYIRLVIDNLGFLHAEYDAPVQTEQAGQTAVEIFIRLAQICEQIYPQLANEI